MRGHHELTTSGEIEWIIPAGHRYRSTPHHYRGEDELLPDLRPPPDAHLPEHPGSL